MFPWITSSIGLMMLYAIIYYLINQKEIKRTKALKANKVCHYLCVQYWFETKSTWCSLDFTVGDKNFHKLVKRPLKKERSHIGTVITFGSVQVYHSVIGASVCCLKKVGIWGFLRFLGNSLKSNVCSKSRWEAMFASLKKHTV